ncbi:MAG: hypothetical protein QM529_06955 [Hydrotalea sp.]|nr:hypothetical protein [Hydrotalea sp.]
MSVQNLPIAATEKNPTTTPTKPQRNPQRNHLPYQVFFVMAGHHQSLLMGFYRMVKKTINDKDTTHKVNNFAVRGGFLNENHFVSDLGGITVKEKKNGNTQRLSGRPIFGRLPLWPCHPSVEPENETLYFWHSRRGSYY